MVVVSILGGLGSQMFKYAMYYSLQKRAVVKCAIDTSYYLQRKSWNGYELNKVFSIDAPDMRNILPYESIENIKNKRRDYICQNLSFLIKYGPVNYYYLGKKIKYNSKYFLNSKLSDFSRIFHHKLLSAENLMGIKRTFDRSIYSDNNCYIDEYSHKSDSFFCDYKNELKSIFNFPLFDKKDRINIGIMNQMKESASVALHVRRTDSLHYNGGLVGRGYYKKAVEYIRQNANSHLVFFLFSDDLEWCKKNYEVIGLRKEDIIVCVDNNKGINSYKDMQLMTYCQHNVLPISSFSWWGYYLSNRENKIVCAPKGMWLEVPIHL